MSGLAIFDLDNCLANDSWRINRIPEQPECDKDWDAYHSVCGSDSAVNTDYVRRHQLAGDRILFITARPVKWRMATLDWLHSWFHGLEHFELLMRPDGDTTPSPALKVRLFNEAQYHWSEVRGAYDDRQDVLDAFRAEGVFNTMLLKAGESRGTAVKLRQAAATFEERNAVYGDNYLRVAPIMKTLWPDGVPSELVFTDRWHLFELLVVKLTRFAISDLTHIDSIHDTAVYAAMIQNDLEERK